MPTFIAVQCPHCHRDQVVKRGKTASGTQRYLCGPAHMKVVLPQVSCSMLSRVIKDALPQQVQFHPTIPTALDELQTVDMAFYRPSRPGKRQRGLDRFIVLPKHRDKVL
jgi:hypothetical protein